MWLLTVVLCSLAIAPTPHSLHGGILVAASSALEPSTQDTVIVRPLLPDGSSNVRSLDLGFVVESPRGNSESLCEQLRPQVHIRTAGMLVADSVESFCKPLGAGHVSILLVRPATQLAPNQWHSLVLTVPEGFETPVQDGSFISVAAFKQLLTRFNLDSEPRIRRIVFVPEASKLVLEFSERVFAAPDAAPFRVTQPASGSWCAPILPTSRFASVGTRSLGFNCFGVDLSDDLIIEAARPVLGASSVSASEAQTRIPAVAWSHFGGLNWANPTLETGAFE